MRISDLEFRRCGATAPSSSYAEIVRWEKSSSASERCYTILVFDTTPSEEPSIRFVGSRPFDIDSTGILWKLMKYGQSILQAEYDLHGRG
jgi:hypothetical protein